MGATVFNYFLDTSQSSRFYKILPVQQMYDQPDASTWQASSDILFKCYLLSYKVLPA